MGIVDVFAGPGGLGEGFSSVAETQFAGGAELAVSIEKDQAAHATLRFRSFIRHLKRQLGDDRALKRLFDGPISMERLYSSFPAEATLAAEEAIRLELGANTRREASRLVKSRLPRYEESVLIGGPPCQAYSLIGRARNRGVAGYSIEADDRAELFVEYLQMLEAVRPAVFVMENVKGLLSVVLHGRSVFSRICEDLSNPAEAVSRSLARRRFGPKYRLLSLAQGQAAESSDIVRPADFIVRSEEYGIPQRRHRVILLGIREDLPLPQHGQLRLVQSINRTVGDTISWLPRLRSGVSRSEDSDDSWMLTIRAHARAVRRLVRTRHPQLIPRLAEIERTLSHPRRGRGAEYLFQPSSGGGSRPVNLTHHYARAHMPSDLARYLFAAVFAEEFCRSPKLGEYPRALLPTHASAAFESGFDDRFRVQLTSEASTTITSHIAKDGHYYIHPDPTQVRSLTVREAALLQTFPLDYVFAGNRTQQYSQVGNAVPPDLAAQIARLVLRLL